MATAPTGRKVGRTPKIDVEQLADYSNVKAPAPPTTYPADVKREWKRIWMLGTWLHREQHYALVKNYCDVLVLIKNCEDALKEYAVIPGEQTSISYRSEKTGQWNHFPELRTIKELLAQKTGLLIELRLTPGTSPVDTSAMKEQLKTLTTQDRS